MVDKFYITTPIYYVNARPHLGHAFTTIAADVQARWWRKRGKKVFFLTGTDEHGFKIEKSALENNPDASLEEIQKFVDAQASIFKKVWRKLNISYDYFIRTTFKEHCQTVINVLNYLRNENLIYPKKYRGLYCPECEEFKKRSDLVEGKCPFHQIKPKIVEEKNFFFKLSKFQEKIKQAITSGEVKIEPETRKNEILKFLEKKLKDISISREKIKWGIPLPFDKKQTTYVWLDAFLNYLSGLGWRGPYQKPSDKFLTFWPPDIQWVGKDILRVHSTIWIGILLALHLPLPKKILAHCFLSLKDQKMSKSVGNVIFPEELIEKFGVDGTRYLLMAEPILNRDSPVSWELFKEKYQADLANGLGNLVSRVFKLIRISHFQLPKFDLTKIENVKKIDALMNEGKIFNIIEIAQAKITYANQLINKKQLWDLIKTHPNEARTIIIRLVKTIINIANILEPITPNTTQTIYQAISNGFILKKQLFPRLPK